MFDWSKRTICWKIKPNFNIAMKKKYRNILDCHRNILPSVMVIRTSTIISAYKCYSQQQVRLSRLEWWIRSIASHAMVIEAFTCRLRSSMAILWFEGRFVSCQDYSGKSIIDEAIWIIVVGCSILIIIDLFE